MQLNQKVRYNERTHEGARAAIIHAEQALRRSVLSCLLFENNAYEDGVSIADRITALIKQVDPVTVSKIAVEARERMGLRHAPLLILREMARLDTHKRYVSRTLERIITRPDQMTDFLALYWKDGKQKLSSKVKQGLAHAFVKFNEYQLAKYNRTDKAVKLRDVLFLSHAKPKDDDQAAVWKRLIANELKTPDTWEVALSSGANKKETWERLMDEHKLGTLAFIRNLRNMQEAGVDQFAIDVYAEFCKVDNIFPYQFIAAACEVPRMEPMLERLMMRAGKDLPAIRGKTILLVDNSGSMATAMNAKSKMMYTDAAAGIAMMVREQCEQMLVYSFADSVTELPPRRGFALRDAIKQTPSGGTMLGAAINLVQAYNPEADRIIVITDEQSADFVTPPKMRGYMMNVANHKNGVGYGNWVHIDGFSSSILRWITEYEKEF